MSEGARTSVIASARMTAVIAPAPAGAISAAPSFLGRTEYWCERCGAPAHLHVLQGYDHGAPHLRHRCLQCGEPDAVAVASPMGRRRPGFFTLALIFGLFIGFSGLFSDAYFPHEQSDLTWLHSGGVAVGALLVLLGALLGADVLVVGGMFLFAGSLMAWMFGLRSAPGLGIKQLVAIGASMAIIGLALAGGVAKRWWKVRPGGAKNTKLPPDAKPAMN